MGRELHSLVNGQRQDAHLHAPMLDHPTSHQRAARQAVLRAMQMHHMSEEQAMALYGHDLAPPPGGHAETADVNQKSMLNKKPASSGGHDWWDRMSRDDQEQYVRVHPHTVMKPNAKRGGATGKSPGEDAAPVKVQAPDPMGLNGVKDAGRTPKPAARNDAPGQATQKGTSEHLQPTSGDRTQWPEHIQALKLPPAWTDVRVSHDPHADLQAIGKDAKGRPQYVYSEAFAKSQSAIKFARIGQLNDQFTGIQRQNARAMASPDERTSQHARCMHLVMEMGLRPGSDDDTGAETKAYGASTLRAEHVTTGPDGKTRLQFVGKKGVHLDLPVGDRKTAAMLQELKKSAGPLAPLFPRVTNSSLLDYAHGLGTGGMKTKDFRTLKGTRTAHDHVQRMTAPTNEREYKKAVRDVAVHVSRQLGNTPSVALNSYISPSVFAVWNHVRPGAPETAADKPPAAPPRTRLPQVHYGAVGSLHQVATLPLRRNEIDDDEMEKTPQSTLKLIGFNPRELNYLQNK